MTQRLLDELVDINQYPKEIRVCAYLQLTIGDMHANALKFLHILTHHGILNISSQDYQALATLYLKSSAGYTRADLEKFHHILANTQVNNLTRLVLIGDEVADRGKNDFFTLKILERLAQGNVKVDILLSNHAFDFIRAYETRADFLPTLMEDQHTASQIALDELVKQNIVTREEIIDLIERAYKPSMKVLSYSLDRATNTISLYSHAGIGINNIPALARKLGVPYQDDTPLALAQTIEYINAVYRRDYVNKNRVHTLVDPVAMQKGYTIGARLDPDTEPFEHLMWNRRYERLKRSQRYKGYNIVYVHGHDSQEQTGDNIFNLDNLLGKSLEHHEERYTALLSNEEQLGKLSPQNNTQRNKRYGQVALGAIAAMVVGRIVGIALIETVLLGLTLALGFCLRKYHYQQMQRRIEQGREPSSVATRAAYRQGRQAAHAYGPYLKSFVDLKAWRHYRYFGAGLESARAPRQSLPHAPTPLRTIIRA